RSPIARHAAAALEFPQRDSQIAIAPGGRQRFGSPLGVVRVGGIADGKLTRICPTAIRVLRQETQADGLASSWKRPDLPAVHDFTGKTHRVSTPARVVIIALLVKDAKPGERRPPIGRAAA